MHRPLHAANRVRVQRCRQCHKLSSTLGDASVALQSRLFAHDASTTGSVAVVGCVSTCLSFVPAFPSRVLGLTVASDLRLRRGGLQVAASLPDWFRVDPEWECCSSHRFDGRRRPVRPSAVPPRPDGNQQALKGDAKRRRAASTLGQGASPRQPWGPRFSCRALAVTRRKIFPPSQPNFSADEG